MYCRYCGKELSDKAFMCPHCGAPTNSDVAQKDEEKEVKPETQNTAQTSDTNKTALAIVAFVLSTFALVTGIIFGAFFYVYVGSVVLLYIIGATTILPALAGLAIGSYLLSAGRNHLTFGGKLFATLAVIYSVIVLLFLFLTACLIVAEAI